MRVFRWFISFLLVTSFVAAFKGEVVAAEENKLVSSQVATTAGQDQYTILVYMNGSDLESEYQAATDDINEMLAGKKGNNINVVIQTGGTKKWHHSAGISNKINQRWMINDSNKLELVENIDTRSIGDPTNLRDFITWGVENYPAEKYVLLFWNHGGGAVGGYGVDELHTEDTGLTLDEIQSSLEEAYQQTETKFELIGFDACLMATVETATILEPYANYLVGSEESEPGDGWYYTSVLQQLTANPNMTGAKLGQVIADAYWKRAQQLEQDEMITLSVTDLSEIDRLNEYISEFSALSIPYMDTMENFYLFMNARTEVQEYSETGMVDLGDYITQLRTYADENGSVLDTDIEALLTNIENSIEEAVLYKVASPTYERAQGLSIYMPSVEQLEETEVYYDVVNLEDYEKYVASYLSKLSMMDDGISFETPITNEEEPSEGDSYSDGGEQIFSVKVQEEDIDRVAELYSVLAMYEEPNSSNLIYLGYDADLSFDRETGIITDNFNWSWVLLDNQFVSMNLYEETDDYLKYMIPALLNGEQVNIIVIFDFSQGNEEAYAEIIGAVKVSDSYMAEKNILKINKGDKIIPLYNTYNEDTEEEGVIEGEEFEVGDELILTEDYLNPGEYLYGFYALDFAGNTTYSDYIVLEVDDTENEEDYETDEEVWEETKNTTVQSDKVWTISFNSKIDEETVTDETIYVVDLETNEIVPTKTTIVKDGQAIEIAPMEEYDIDAQYELVISSDIKDIKGKSMKKNTVMYFDIAY